MTYQAFFFDFDGVLADSVKVKTKAFATLFESYGPEIRAKVEDHHHQNGGMTRRDKFRHYYNEFLKEPLDDVEMERLCRAFSLLVVDEVIRSPEIPGAQDFLNKWHEEVPCFIVSATPDEEIRLIVKRRGLEKYFREVLGSSRSKEKNLEYVLSKYGFIPERCIFFGDAESDYRAAMASNVDFIGIVPGLDAPLLGVAPNIRWAENFIDLNMGK
ncbi:MAG: HAD family hydrolase [Candidatus Thorarchaeota archaeon]|jgi:beta-phosphoglucomutase-like phosphatase (HAD superfamily)